ncbi:hypothetical protein NDU88_004185 [Pleurodeles waltl]|uniref:Uncharacterized protein n=1 Tax=Pleurodeles waltl TaxID=8319 RepID=A0AAV7VHI3_PLEWA|nr:hypothetical protein NDU88_004185 [Pleurodeles waltl]
MVAERCSDVGDCAGQPGVSDGPGRARGSALGPDTQFPTPGLDMKWSESGSACLRGVFILGDLTLRVTYTGSVRCTWLALTWVTAVVDGGGRP